MGLTIEITKEMIFEAIEDRRKSIIKESKLTKEEDINIVNEKAKEYISYINELTEHTFERQIKKVLSVPFKLDAFDELKRVKIVIVVVLKKNVKALMTW